MRGSINKTSLKKQTSLDNNRPMYGAKTIFLAHEATLGDTGIDLTSLSMPTSLYDKGYRNPSQKEIEELNLSFYSSYLKIVSTVKNELMKVSYDVVSGTQINFDGWTADSGEIFELTFASPPMGGSQYFDARPLVKTYLLPEGETDIIVDDFEINKFPDYQMGAVMMQRSVGGLPVTQLRNVGNSPTGDGNYYEVAGVAGVSKILRCNTAAGVGGDIIVVTSIGALVQAPQQTFLSYIETINGAQQKIIDALVALGYTRSDFEALPNNVDLATFGDQLNSVLNLEIDVVESPDTEIRYLSASVKTDGTINDFTFTGLEIGKDYVLNAQLDIYLNHTAVDSVLTLNTFNGAQQLTNGYYRDTEGSALLDSRKYIIYKRFTAVATTVTFVAGSATNFSYIYDGGNYNTYAQLSKVPTTTKTKIRDLI